MKPEQSTGITVIAAIAIAFGLLAIKSGGSVIFIDGAARQAAGNHVPFVARFNFIAGFIYLVAGSGLWLQKRRAVKLSLVIVIATLPVFALPGLHILNNGLYEMRTVIAMSIRTLVWAVITLFSYRYLMPH